MPANYAITTRLDGETLTAAKYNADHQSHIDNGTPVYHDDYSASVSQMRSQVNPGAVGSESLPTNLAGELERMRFAMYQKHVAYAGAGATYWYAPAKTMNCYNVEEFGASAGGTAASNTTAINAAMTVAAASNGTVLIQDDYAVTNVLIPNGVRSVMGPGSFIGTGIVGNAVVELSETVINLDYSVRINMSGGALRGIYGVAQSSRFHDFTISNYNDLNGHNGILLRPDSGYVAIHNCNIQLYQPPFTTGFTATGIALISNITNEFGTYFSSGTGASEDPTQPVHHITISGCHIFGGSHGIFAQGIRQCTISGNTIQRSWHRSMALEPSCKFNTITGNTCYDFYSSAILLAYGAQFNTVSGNMFGSTLTNGQAVINLYLGPVGNIVTGNTIHVGGTAPLYGIYCSIGARENHIVGNRISGHRLAGIMVESDWVTSGGAPHTYSGITPGAPPSGTTWAFQNSTSNVIQSNFIGAPTTGGSIAGIALTGVRTTYSTIGTVVQDNHVSSTSHTVLFFVGETDPAAPVSSTYLIDNTWPSGVTITLGPRGQLHYTALRGNHLIDEELAFAFADADATPDVTIGRLFTCANTGSTTITQFDGSIKETREITVKMDVNTGITHDNAKIRLLGGSNIAVGTVDSNFFIHFIYMGGIWFEQWRRN